MPPLLRRSLQSALRVLLLFSIMVVLIGFSVSRPTWVWRDGSSQLQRADPVALRAHVVMLSEQLPARSSDRAKHLAQSADYLFQQFSQATASVTRQGFKTVGREFQNVVAHFGPDTGSTTVVGAHYDAYLGFPGADDNASGVAALLELGRLLGTLGDSELQQRVILVAYALEEPPHYASDAMGSVVHAQSLESENIELMISLEMIGYYSDEPNSQRYPSALMRLYYPSRGNFIAVVEQYFANNAVGIKAAFNRHTNIPAYSVNAPALVPGIDYSDHRSYWAAGIPAVMITDTAFHRNLAYHTPFDSADRLDYERMAEVVRGVYHYLIAQR